MIDSLLIFRELRQIEYQTVYNSLIDNFIVTKRSNSSNIIKFSLNINNLRVILSKNYLTIKGSLPKFYTDNQLSNLTRQAIEKAIRKLENILGISLDTGYVYKLELSQIIYLDKHISEYLPIFQKVNYCKKKRYNTSVLFFNNRKSLIVYDKKEIITKNNIELEGLEYITTPVKIEIRLKNKLKHQLTQFYKKQAKKGIVYNFINYEWGNSLTVKDLYTEDTYNFLYEFWKNSVLSIKYRQSPKNSYKEFITKVNNTTNYYR